MGLFGGGNSSSNQTTNNFTETVTAGADNGALTAQNSTVNVTDGGAFDVVNKSLDTVMNFAGSVVNNSQQLARDSQTQAAQFSEVALTRATASSGASMEAIGKYAVIAAGLFAVVKAWGKNKK